MINLSLDGAGTVEGLRVDRAYWASSECGVGADDGVHAGDYVVVCNSRDGATAGLFVSRHWAPPNVGALSWLLAVGNSCHGVARISLEFSSSQGSDGTTADFGAYPPRTASSRRVRGMGLDGIPKVVIWNALYIDDFLNRERWKLSAGGVYVYYHGCVADRVRSSAVRTISVTPPGLSSDLVLDAIAPDRTEGTTKGWLLKDYKGSPVRIMADTSLYIAYYVQVSKSGSMRGHNAQPPCPLCAYSLPGGQGSQVDGPGSAEDTGSMRTSRRTAAVCNDLPSESKPWNAGPGASPYRSC